MSEFSDLAAAVGWVAGALLVLAGVAKLRAPDGTVTALRDAGWPGSSAAVRLLGAVEVVTGTAVLALGGRLPSGVAAVLYVGFAVFVARQRRSSGASSCGCFGAARSPVTRTHLVVNVLAAGGTGLAAVTATGPVTSLAGDGPLPVLTAFLLVVAGAWLLRVALTAGAELSAAVALHPRPQASR